MKRRLALAVVLASLLPVAACSDDGTSHKEVVEIFGPYRDEEADLFVASLRSSPALRGIEIRYTGSRDFVSDLLTRVRDDGNPPDIAIVPQLGVVRDLAAANSLVPVGPTATGAMAANYTDAARALGEIDGRQVGVPYRVTLKSIVWYRPSVFAANGWQVPATMDELASLVDTIDRDSPMAPWCFGIQAGASTGWTATDWVEDLVLRLAGPDTYDLWVDDRVEFADPAIQDSFSTFEGLVLRSGRSAGGKESILGTPVDQVAPRLLAEPSVCALYKQADFARGWFPTGTSFGPESDVDFFVLPGKDGGEAPLVVGADLAVPFADRAAVDTVLAALASPEGSTRWQERGSFISPQGPAPGADLDATQRRLDEVVASASTVRMDASDTMPAAVGTAFWGAITRWISGAQSYAQLAAELDALRPAR